MILVQARFTKPEGEQMITNLRSYYESDAEMLRDALRRLSEQRKNMDSVASVASVI